MSDGQRSDVDYARYKGPPAEWRRLAVFDAATGQKLMGVIEANAAEGWFVRHVRGEDGKILRNGPDIVTERVEAAILILRCHGCGAPIRPPSGWKPDHADRIERLHARLAGLHREPNT